MQEQFLLDTNAYFNFMKYTAFLKNEQDGASYVAELERIKEAECFISAISRMEIILENMQAGCRLIKRNVIV